MLHGLWRDLWLAARRLAATPLFTTFAVLSLALGVGVTTAVYSVVDSVFLKGLGILEPGRVVFVVTAQDARLTHDLISDRDLDALRERQRSFLNVAAFMDISAAVASPVTTEELPGEAVDGAYFSTLGVRTIVGRAIQSSDERAAARVAVLSYQLRRSRFASDANVVGRIVRVSGYPFEVIGVAPEWFEGPTGWFRGAKIWVPLGVAPLISPAYARGLSRLDPDGRGLTVIGRLRPGRSVATASAELATLSASLDAAYPRRSAVEARVTRRAWAAQSVDAFRKKSDIAWRFGLVIVGLVALVLVVACTNLSNLVLARGTVRQQEFAIRRALGASRWRLVREQCAESLLIAVAGGAAACVVIQALRVATNVDLPLGASWMVSIQPTFNIPALGATAAALLLSLIVFGLEPALQLTRTRDIRAALVDGAGTGGAPKTKRQRLLIRWQVAISSGFFIIATMCVKYTIAEARHDSGIDLDRLAVAILHFDAQRWDADRTRYTLERVAAEAAKDPAVRAVTVSTGLPFGTPQLPMLAYLSVPDRPVTRTDAVEGALAIAATPSVFRTIGVPLLRGRAFDDRDHANAPPVLVVPAQTAREIFGTTDVVGRQLTLRRWVRTADPVTATIVGVTRDTDVGGLMYREGRLVYQPFAQHVDGPRFASVTARAAGKPAIAVRALRDAIRKVDPDLAIEMAGTGRVVLGGPSLFLRAIGFGALGLGALTLLLAMVGLYGVQSHVIAHRTREIGLRMSFGATTAQIKRMVLKDGYRPVLEGLAIGLFIGFASRAIIRSYLVVKISLVDPWVLALIPIALVLAAFWACYLPAARAARVDPNVALRAL